MRGLDYYTRTVFEFTCDALGAQSGVGGGGRYDGLVAQLGGPPTPGMGWAAGVERILLAGSPPVPESPELELYVASDFKSPPQGGAREPRVASRRAAFGLLSEARAAGMTAQMEIAGRSLKGQLGQADRLGARWVAIVEGEQTVLKDMQGSTEQTVATAEVVQTVRGGPPVQPAVQGST